MAMPQLCFLFVGNTTEPQLAMKNSFADPVSVMRLKITTLIKRKTKLEKLHF